MSIKILDNLNRIDLSLDLNLIRFHGLLDQRSDIPKPDIDAGLLDAGIGGILDSLEKLIVRRVESYSEGCIDDSTVDVRTEVDLADIVIADYRVVSRVGRVVGGHVV